MKSLRVGEEILAGGFTVSKYVHSDGKNKKGEPEPDLCRFSRKEIEEGGLVLFCPNDEEMTCNDCRYKDNEYEHSKRYLKHSDPSHVHYTCIYRKMRETSPTKGG